MTHRYSCTRFVIDHTNEDAPVCDAVSRANELRVHAAANVVELFVQALVVLQTIPILDSRLTNFDPFFGAVGKTAVVLLQEKEVPPGGGHAPRSLDAESPEERRNVPEDTVFLIGIRPHRRQRLSAADYHDPAEH
ncbi:hypothetical protein TNCV_3749231 [Trichonephila clavipes]|nr:hypothetical protein TNCV_3749231 [Trichonephila clavipes]